MFPILDNELVYILVKGDECVNEYLPIDVHIYK